MSVFMPTLLEEKIVDTIEILRTQLEGNLDPVDTANVRGRINAMKAVLQMHEDLKQEQK